MEYFVDDTDFEILTKDFLSKLDFLQWHNWAYEISLSDILKEGDGPTWNPSETADWLHHCRMDISQGVFEIIQYHLDNENYEIIQSIKDKESQLRVEALEIEMKLERLF